MLRSTEAPSSRALPIRRSRRLRPGALLGVLVHYLVVLAIVVGMAFPLLWMVYSSLKTNREIFRSPFGLPTDPHFAQFAEAWVQGGLGRFYLNSTFVVFASVLLIVSLSSLAAYAFARLRFRGRDAIYYTFLIGLMLPPQVVVIPLFVMLRDLQLLNTYWALILPYAGWSLSLTIYLLRSFFLTLPNELEDASKMDGANVYQRFYLVMLPLVRPALVTVTILNVVNLWNELMFALLFIQDDAKRTLPAGLLAFYGYHNVDYRLVFSALTLATLPILFVYFFFQRQVIEGLTVGSVDG